MKRPCLTTQWATETHHGYFLIDEPQSEKNSIDTVNDPTQFTGVPCSLKVTPNNIKIFTQRNKILESTMTEKIVEERLPGINRDFMNDGDYLITHYSLPKALTS